MCLAEGHKEVMPMRLEPTAHRTSIDNEPYSFVNSRGDTLLDPRMLLVMLKGGEYGNNQFLKKRVRCTF